MPNGFAFRTKGRSDYAMQLFSTLLFTAIAPSSQSTATLLTADTNLVNVVPSGGAVKLPRAESGRSITVINGQATNALTIWPYVGDGINTQSINTILTGNLAVNTAIIFYCGVQGTWWSK
jgi:hypothetical protein